MTDNVDARISRLLAQLESPALTERQEKSIMRKVEFLREQQLEAARCVPQA